MADLKRRWTPFALEAEYDAYGMARIMESRAKRNPSKIAGLSVFECPHRSGN